MASSLPSPPVLTPARLWLGILGYAAAIAGAATLMAFPFPVSLAIVVAGYSLAIYTWPDPPKSAGARRTEFRTKLAVLFVWGLTAINLPNARFFLPAMMAPLFLIEAIFHFSRIRSLRKKSESTPAPAGPAIGC